MSKYQNLGGIFPTIFDFPEMWKLNSTRCNGRFNIFFFWMYPLAAMMMIPFTLLCVVELWVSGPAK